MISVVKRDGEVVEFNLEKISGAIAKAFTATQKNYTEEIIGLLALRVTSDFQDKVKEQTISVEDIQDSVEHVLESTGYTDVAKAYILYRKNREKIRNMSLEELKAEEQELRAQLFKLRFKSATSPIDNPVQVRYIKRDIARVKTVIKEKELAASAQ